MATNTVKLEGADQLRKKLLDLDKKVARKISSQALRAGAKIVLERARQLVPVKSGTLKRSLKVRAGKRKGGRISFVVQTKAGDYRGETFYGSFLEFGHKVGKRRRVKGLTDTREAVPPKPFLRPAFDQTKDAALAAITTTLQAGIAATQ